jgi:CHAT domain-containing protein
MPLLAPISVGELFDKISILEIKAEALTNPAKQANVRRELAALEAVRERQVAASPELAALYAELKSVNRTLWRTEDEIRECERAGQFDARFIELARSVYRENDRRALLKRQINELTGSEIVEEKSYV